MSTLLVAVAAHAGEERREVMNHRSSTTTTLVIASGLIALAAVGLFIVNKRKPTNMTSIQSINWLCCYL